MTFAQPLMSDDPATALAALRRECRTAILATVDTDAQPDASYTPFVDDAATAGAVLILVSGLARHTANMLRSRRASVMLILDESGAAQVFARRRATFLCRVEEIARGSPTWASGVDALQARHGAVVAMVRELGDFQLLRLVPESGTLVLGFGRAFRLTGPGCEEIEPIRPR